MEQCGFCRSEVPDGAILCRNCGAYKLKKSYKVGKLMQAYLGGMLTPIAGIAAFFVWQMHLPKILFGLTGIVALLGIYFLMSARQIRKQWDYWHRR